MLVERIANSLINEGIISEEDMDIIRFGLESLIGNLLGFVLTLIIGTSYNRILDAMLLWVLLFCLRKNAGGFHADTKGGCVLISTVMLIVCFAAFAMYNHTKSFYGLYGIIAGSYIWLWAPVDTLTKKLDESERRVYKNRSRIVVITELGLLLLALHFDCIIVARCVNMAFFMVSISLFLGGMKQRKNSGIIK